jgi:hypothetical protein
VDNHALAEGPVPDPVDPFARITTSQAAAYAGVTAAAVTNWRRRGYLTPVDHQRGRPIYILLDVAKAEHATRRRARRLSPMRRFLALLVIPFAAVFAFAAPAFAGSAHYVGTPAVTISGPALTVTAKEAGLGDLAQIHVTLTGTATCINGGGQNPNAANKTTVTAAADEPVQNGHSDYTLTVAAVFDPGTPCPGPMGVAYSDVVLTDVTNGISVQILP